MPRPRALDHAPPVPVPPRRDGPPRLAAVDLARGLAVAAMAAYHLGWDLSFLQLVVTDVTASRGWQIAARLIAGSFLVLVGIGLVLGHGGGVRRRPFLRRLGLVGGGALLVTAATALAVPEGLIFFGILHCIAVSSVLALPFLARPAWASLAAALAVLAAGLLVRDPLFDQPWLRWAGLGTEVPATNDYVPLFPWFAWVLAGVAAAKAGAPLLRRAASWRPQGRPARALVLAGRHSLGVYLLHQPLLLAVLVPLAWATGPNPAAVEARFRHGFLGRCEQTGTAAETCGAVHACLVGRLRGTEAWARIVRDQARAEDARSVRGATLACYGEVLPGR